MYLLFAPPEKFGQLPQRSPLLTDEVPFSFNIAYCSKYYWKKFHVLQGCRDITPGWMIRMRNRRDLKNILIIANGGIGDSMWCMPVAAALREKFPRSIILIACNERVMPAWQNVPYANMCVKDEFWNLQSLIRTADEVYDISGNATATMQNIDPVEAAFKTCDLNLPKEKKKCRPQLTVTIDEGKRAEAYLKREGIDVKNDKFICIALESSTSNRNWVFDYVKELSKKVIDERIKVVWLGESQDFETRMLDDETNSIGAVNLTHRTSLRESMAIIALSDVFIGPASGLMVIATALEIPTVGLFGAFDPKTRDKYYDKFIPLYHKITCAPCGQHWTECQKGHPAPCMKVIGPGEVYDAIKKLLKLYPRPIISKLPLE